MPRVSTLGRDTAAGGRSVTPRRAKAGKAASRRGTPGWASIALRQGGKIAACGLFVGALVWTWQSGWIAQQARRTVNGIVAATNDAGLSVHDIQVTGRKNTDRKQLLDILALKRGDPILGFSPERVRLALEALPWVRTASVERHLPDVVFIRLTERVPMALWQHDQKLALIDETGTVLTREGLEKYRDLPILVGADAPKQAQVLFAELSKVPDVWRRVDAATWIGDRRWDLRLDSGVTVRLPESGITEALTQLATADAEHKLLDRDIVAIDLRVPDRMAVQVSVAAAERRHAPEEKI